MIVDLLWLAIIWVAGYSALHVWPRYEAWIIILTVILILTQIHRLIYGIVRRYNIDLEVNRLSQEAADEMEATMRDPTDETPLTRFKAPAPDTRQMNADQLLDYARKKSTINPE